MTYDSKSAIADPIVVRSTSHAPRVARTWRNPITITTVSTAVLAAAFLLVSPEVGIGAAVGGVAIGVVSAGFAFAGPATRRSRVR